MRAGADSLSPSRRLCLFLFLIFNKHLEDDIPQGEADTTETDDDDDDDDEDQRKVTV